MVRLYPSVCNSGIFQYVLKISTRNWCCMKAQCESVSIIISRTKQKKTNDTIYLSLKFTVKNLNVLNRYRSLLFVLKMDAHQWK